jgi:cysteinyl-tRNA synthetase
MNVTDIDDKIIIRSNELKEDFAQFARRWENEFFLDMKALGVKMPDVLTRVSEFVPEIVAYIETIMKNGYAYVSNGSVYFDITAFKASGKHTYGKLDPSSMSDQSKVLPFSIISSLVRGRRRNARDAAQEREEASLRFCALEEVEGRRAQVAVSMVPTTP